MKHWNKHLQKVWNLHPWKYSKQALRNLQEDIWTSDEKKKKKKKDLKHKIESPNFFE